jgi:hypothetical protein
MLVRNEQWSVSRFARERTRIDAQPEYQRGEVWSLPKRQLLIDSILRQFDIPKIYLRKLTGNALHDYQIVDGQQRLTSIWWFLNDEFALAESDDDPAWSGKRCSQLSKPLRRRLDQFKLVTAIIENASQDHVRELFARLQKGERLTPAELRNSMKSTIGAVIRMTAENHLFFKSCPFPAARFRHHDLAAHLFAVEVLGLANDLKAPTLRELYLTHADDSPASVPGRVHRVLDYLHEMQSARPRCIRTKWGLVDLYTVIATNRASLPQASVLADRYSAFEARRLRFVGDPDVLLTGKTRDRSLYDYIQAFSLEASRSRNLKSRAKLLTRKLFKTT